MKLPAGFLRALAEGDEEALAVEVVFEDGFTLVTSVHEGKNRTRKLDTQWTGHAANKHQPAHPLLSIV
jgi:hypothetical protein